MSESILIKNARFILSKDQFLENKDVLIRDKIIQDDSDKTGTIIDGSNYLVMPGLANMHTHSPMTLFRGYASNLDLQSWHKKIWELEVKLKPKYVRAAAELACLEMVKTGTIFFNDMYFFMEEVAEAAKKIGLKYALSHGILDFMKDGLEKTEKLANYLSPSEFVVGPHSIYTCSEETLLRAKELAQKHNTKLHLHLAETRKEVEDCIKKHGKSSVEYLDSLGLLGSDTILAHCCWLSSKDIKLLKETTIVHCPISNQKLSSGKAPYISNVCLGTDGPSSNNSLNMFNEMKFQALLHKVPSKEIILNQLNIPAKLFNLPTSVEPSQPADLILIDINKLCPLDKNLLFEHLVYSFNGDVDSVIINGKLIEQEIDTTKFEEEREDLFSIQKQ